MVISPMGMALAIAALMALGEWLHQRRCRRIALLAFVGGAPRTWVSAVPWLRIAAATLVTWGLTTLLVNNPADLAGEDRQAATKRLVIALDVSPSMDLNDAGPNGRESRAQRARDVLRSVLSRADLTGVRLSIVALYNGARPVVVDTIDPEVVRNVLDDLPLEHAFSPGKTTLYEAIAACATLAQGSRDGSLARPQPWPPGQARLIVVSDGDSVAPAQSVRLPPAFSGTLVIGVGDATRGMSIDGHLSRQESSTLRQLAGRFGGSYHDGNRRHVPSELLAELFPTRGNHRRTGLGDLALAAVVAGAALLALLPALLALAGAPRFAHPLTLQPVHALAHSPRSSSHVPA